MDFRRAAFYICLLSCCSKQKSSELRRKQSRSNSSSHSVTLRIACATATVGTPVARRPPCSPGRAVFPPPVPRLLSLPRRGIPCVRSPAGRLAHAVPVRRVRAALPCRAACFRRVLPPVVGFPHLGV